MKHHEPIHKTPILSRSWRRVLLALSIALAPSPVALGQTNNRVSEADVVRIARTTSPGAELARANTSLAESRAQTAGLLPNPTLSWSRETVETGPVGSQDIITAALPMEFVRPKAVRALAAANSARTAVEASLLEDEVVLDAVLSYYAVVLAKKNVELLAGAIADLEEAERVLARREVEGTASGYESTRLAVATELARSRAAQARGALESSRAHLATLLAQDPATLDVGDAIELMQSDQATTLAGSHGVSRAALQRAAIVEQRVSDAGEQAEWAWVPRLELGAGLKRVSDQGGGVGYVVGVSVDIPLFDHGQALQREAGARRAVARAEARALQTSIDVKLARALAAFTAARAELQRFERESAAHVEALLVAAQSGYREGERSLLELLDAQQAQTEVAERRLELLATAKEAEVRLRSAAGELK